jgi:hypothetical protein
MKKNQIYLLFVITILSIAFIYSFRTDFPHELASGAIGAILTVIVTMFLLEKQTGSEEIKAKNSKVFEKKLEIYDEFLKLLHKIILDKKIDEVEKQELIFQIAQIKTHTSGEHIIEIFSQIKRIIGLFKEDPINIDNTELTEALFEIVEIFQKELYQKTLGKSNISFEENIKELLQDIQETDKNWAKITFNDFDKYKEGQKLRRTTDGVLELIKFIDIDIKNSFPDTFVRMSNTHYAFFIGEPGRGNRFFGVSPEKNKLRISFPKEIAEKYKGNWILRNSWPDLLSTYITTKEEYLNQIKEIVEENYKNINSSLKK